MTLSVGLALNTNSLIFVSFMAASLIYILRGKNIAIYFGDTQFRRNRFFNFIISKKLVDKCLHVR